jgi:hypothetical protein
MELIDPISDKNKIMELIDPISDKNKIMELIDRALEIDNKTPT